MDRRRRRTTGVADAVDVGGVELEGLARVALAARVVEPARSEVEPILDERALADVHRARGNVVVVVARLLVVEPADQPHVEVRVAMELDVDPGNDADRGVNKGN